MRNHILSFIIILLLTIFKVEGVRASSTMNYYSITTFEGLPSNTVSAIKKDASGFIWFGTKVGLCRFDGCEVKTYPLLSEDDIWSIEELDNDTLLLGTVSGLQSEFNSEAGHSLYNCQINPENGGKPISCGHRSRTILS